MRQLIVKAGPLFKSRRHHQLRGGRMVDDGEDLPPAPAPGLRPALQREEQHAG